MVENERGWYTWKYISVHLFTEYNFCQRQSKCLLSVLSHYCNIFVLGQVVCERCSAAEKKSIVPDGTHRPGWGTRRLPHLTREDTGDGWRGTKICWRRKFILFKAISYFQVSPHNVEPLEETIHYYCVNVEAVKASRNPG